MLRIRDTGGTLRTIGKLSVKDDGGVVRELQKLSVKDGGVLRQVFSSITASATTPVTGIEAVNHPVRVSTTPSTATPTGGVAPYAYAWAVVNSSFGTWDFDAPTSDTTSARCSFLAPGADASAQVQCTITDAVGSTAPTNLVDAFAQNTG
jgi:hypothetical protein